MPPHRSWWRGRDAIGDFMKHALPLCPDARHMPTWANGQPAIAWYLWGAESESYVATAIEIPTLEGERVKGMISFVTPEIFPRFGLPDELPSSPVDRTTAWTNRLSS
jgi:RNA polymerase sigma-70 factor (ECF subfamily)